MKEPFFLGGGKRLKHQIQDLFEGKLSRNVIIIPTYLQ